MGAWGSGIWDNDTACDIELDLKDNLKEYLTKEEAISNLIKSWEDTSDVLTMMVLADIQLEYNMIVSRELLIEALNLAIEEREKYLDDWRNPEERKNVINKFELKVRSYLENKGA